MTDFRALCAELIELDRNSITMRSKKAGAAWSDALARASAAMALAQPAPAAEGPTDEELDELYFDLDATEVMSWRAFARAVLARWGRLADSHK